MLTTLLALTTLAYDPLKIDPAFRPETLNLELRDEKRDREIPIRVYLPATKQAAPIVIFSHGLGGNRNGNAYVGQHLAARGYVAIHIQHPGSDESVWRGVRPGERMAAMRKAASGANLLLRVADVPFVLDALREVAALKGRLDLEKVGMSGHSFGAVTTQAVSGQSYVGQPRYTEPRIDAALAYSPSKGPGTSFDQVKIPWLLMTGTEDTSPINSTTVEDRLAVFPALPPGQKYELVLFGGAHSAFTDRALPGDQKNRNPNHHRAILAISTAFWDSTLRSDPQARAWLDGEGAKAVLEPKDRWQIK